MQVELSSKWAATKEWNCCTLTLHLQYNFVKATSLRKLGQLFDRGGAQLQSSNHPVSASNSLISAGAERSWCKRRQDIIQPCCFPCKKRKVWASILAKLPLKPYIRRINLISKLQFQERWCVSHMHFHGMHALSESFPRLASHAPLPHFRPRNQNRSVPSFGAWSVMNICRKLAAWSHDIHQRSVSLPEYLTNSWSSYCMGFESCRFQKKLLLSSRVWWIPDENTMLAWAILKVFQFLSNLAALQKFNASILAFKNSWSAGPLVGKPELFAETGQAHICGDVGRLLTSAQGWLLGKRFQFLLGPCCIGRIQCSQFGLPEPQISLLHLNNSCEVISRPVGGKTRGICWMLHKRSHAERQGDSVQGLHIHVYRDDIRLLFLKRMPGKGPPEDTLLDVLCKLPLLFPDLALPDPSQLFCQSGKYWIWFFGLPGKRKRLTFLFPLSRGAACIDSPPSRNTRSVTKPIVRTRLQHHWIAEEKRKTDSTPARHIFSSNILATHAGRRYLYWKSGPTNFFRSRLRMLVHAGGVVIQMSSHKGVKLLHFDSSPSIQLCQSNKSAKAGPAIWQRRRSITVFKSPCQCVKQSDICWSWKKLVQEETRYHTTVLLPLQKEESLSFYPCKTSFETIHPSH